MKQLFLLFIFFTSLNLWSQKTAPIAGDAALLIDLLQKDYNSGDPERVLEDIARDRTKVIAIFKTYMNSSFEPNTPYEIDKLRSSYIKSLEEYNLNMKQENPNLKYDSLNNRLKTDKENYFNALYSADSLLFNEVITHLSNENAFLNTIVKKFKYKYENLKNGKSDIYAINNSTLSIQKGLPFTGGDLLIEGIDGLSRFLATRIKEELTLNAIQNIQKYLENKDRHPYLYELEVVLPTTIAYLKEFDADQLLKFSDDLKQYIEEDLNQLVTNAANLRRTPRVALLIAKNPDLDFIFEGLDILNQVTKIKSPVDYFEIVSNSRNINRWRLATGPKKDIADGLHLASMIAYSLTVVENAEVKFVTTDFMANYGSQLDFCYLYFGFLHQQNIKYFEIKYSQPDGTEYITHFVNNIDEVATYHNFLKHEVFPVVEHTERLHNQFLAIKKNNKNGDKIDYAQMHQLIEDLVGYAEEVTISGDWILDKVDASLPKKAEKLAPYFQTARTANNITLDLYEKRYTNAITKALEIPYILETSNVQQPAWWQASKNTVETGKKLLPLKNVLFMRIDLPDAHKLELWKKNKVQLENLQKDFAAHDSLQTLGNILEQLLTATPDIAWDETGFTQNRTTLINSLKIHKKVLLSYLGVDTQEFKEFIESQELNQETQKIFLTKFDKYTTTLFQQNVFNVNHDDYIIAEEELVAAYNAFIPKLSKTETIKSEPKLVKIIHFVNDIAVSDSPEAYEKAIEAFVLPVGSSSLKEKAKSYYAINSFPGLLQGFEITNHIDNAGFIGFTAPVGLYLQPWGSNKYFLNSIGFFLPVIDIAAPVRLRLDDSNDTETLPDFEFKDIFAPGVYAVFGIRNSPFAFNLGIQYGPKLRNIPIDDSDVIMDVESYRLGLGLTIDIPLLTLSSKYKN
jgi:hypothetical protein